MKRWGAAMTTTSPSRYVRVATAAPAFYDRARFYTIDGRRFPSVTTILDVINKPALGPWYAKMERQASARGLSSLSVAVGPGPNE